MLLRLQETLEQVADDGLPHMLCGYLYELACCSCASTRPARC
jgi:arginyl-tRNA synthetase